MTTVLSIAGFAIAIVIFLNLLHAKDTIKEAAQSDEEKAAQEERRSEARRVLKTASSRRMCPVCRTGLTREEYLICAMDENRGINSKRQVHIFGCPHCFTTDGVNFKKYEIVKDF